MGSVKSNFESNPILGHVRQLLNGKGLEQIVLDNDITAHDLLSDYCLTKISIRAKRWISPASFPCLSFPVPFLYIGRTKAVLTGLKAY